MKNAMDYEHGLELLKEIAKGTDWYQEVALYETMLRDCLREERRYGRAPQTHQELLRAVDQLNYLCLQRQGVSFTDLCLGATDTPANIRSERSHSPAGTDYPAQLERQIGPIVCLYARDDEPFYRELQTSLSLWQRQGKLTWLERSAGDHITRTTREHLRLANLILLLCSASFFEKAACYEAMETALQEHARRQVPVVPILARACAWEESACGLLDILPTNRQPINEWAHADRAYEHIRLGLARRIFHQ